MELFIAFEMVVKINCLKKSKKIPRNFVMGENKMSIYQNVNYIINDKRKLLIASVYQEISKPYIRIIK